MNNTGAAVNFVSLRVPKSCRARIVLALLKTVLGELNV